VTRLQSIQLLGFRDNLHVAHWQAPRKTNEHATLGELYDAVLGKVDELTELAIARDGDLEFAAVNIGITNRAPYQELLGSGLTLLAEIRDTFKPGADDDALNIIADMCADIRRAGYKLEVTLP
jgi:hypothetical protein